MKFHKVGLAAAVVAAAFAAPAMAEQAVVSSGTGVAVTSGTGVAVTPGATMYLIPGSTVRNGGMLGTETVVVTDSNTAVMGAPAGSTVTITRYAAPLPPANGYLRSDWERYRALGR